MFVISFSYFLDISLCFLESCVILNSEFLLGGYVVGTIIIKHV